MILPFLNRAQAGRLLAKKLSRYRNQPDVLVLALPRGGVPVAWEVARFLGTPLDIVVVRKLGVPGFDEIALGAVASGGVRVLNQAIVRAKNLSPAVIGAIVEREERELHRRELAYRRGCHAPELQGRTAILVDDGLATGSTMLAAVKSVRLQKAGRVVVAVPVAAPSTCNTIEAVADEVICLATPENFDAVGLWYREFPQVSDDEVQELLSSEIVVEKAVRHA